MATPHRAHELICKIGADTAERLADELRTLAMMVERNELSVGCVGGPTCGALYSYKHDADMTHDRYFQEINASLESARAVEQTADALKGDGK